MRRIFVALAIALLLACSMRVALATDISVVLNFSPSNWTGSLTYDDTSGQPWSVDNDFTAYAIVAMSITNPNEPFTWTEADLDPALSMPDTYGAIVDAAGRVALFASTDNQNPAFVLSAAVGFDNGTNTFTSTALLYGGDEGDLNYYTARTVGAPTPTTLLLLGSGLTGLGGIAWRRRR